jgi:fatty acid desaturase
MLAAEAPTYHSASRSLRSELAAAVPKDVLKRLHETSGWRHALVVLRQGAVLAAAVAAILLFGERPWVWIPASIAIGFVVFSFSVLLHEVVHRTVFAGRRSRGNAILGGLYGVVSGLSPTQFTRWHLDHHDWLGTADRDPKRHHLTPKIVRRWYKALYLTPALFPIYFRASARETATYPEEVRRRIRLEKRVVLAFHLGLAAALCLLLSPVLALKLHLLPVLVVFPVAFTTNRLGQHYDVDPSDPAKWGTLMKESRLWDWVFLWSGHHLEHHYFPRVPFYRLPALRRELRGFFEARGSRERGYAGLLWDWFARNRAPHTDWAA